MQKYVGREMKPAIESFQVKSAVSKDGQNYNYISLRLINGFEKRIFLQNAEEFAFLNSFELLATRAQVDAQMTPLNSNNEAF